MDLNKIYNLDCINGIKRIEDEKIDLVIEHVPINWTQIFKICIL